MKKLNLFAHIDQFLFKLVEQLRQKKEYQDVETSFSHLDHEIKEWIKRLLAVTIFVSPLVVVSLLNNFNNRLKEDINHKKQLIQYANDIIVNTNQAKRARRMAIAKGPINNEMDLINTITQALSSSAIDTSKIKTSNYERENLDGNIVFSQIDLKFDNLSAQEMYSMLTALATRAKLSIEKIAIKKDEKKKMIFGQMALHHYAEDIIDEGF